METSARAVRSPSTTGSDKWYVMVEYKSYPEYWRLLPWPYGSKPDALYGVKEMQRNDPDLWRFVVVRGNQFAPSVPPSRATGPRADAVAATQRCIRILETSGFHPQTPYLMELRAQIRGLMTHEEIEEENLRLGLGPVPRALRQ